MGFVKFLEPGGSAHASSLIHIPLIPFLSCVFPVRLSGCWSSSLPEGLEQSHSTLLNAHTMSNSWSCMMLVVAVVVALYLKSSLAHVGKRVTIFVYF